MSEPTERSQQQLRRWAAQFPPEDDDEEEDTFSTKVSEVVDHHRGEPSSLSHHSHHPGVELQIPQFWTASDVTSFGSTLYR